MQWQNEFKRPCTHQTSCCPAASVKGGRAFGCRRENRCWLTRAKRISTPRPQPPLFLTKSRSAFSSRPLGGRNRVKTKLLVDDLQPSDPRAETARGRPIWLPLTIIRARRRQRGQADATRRRRFGCSRRDAGFEEQANQGRRPPDIVRPRLERQPQFARKRLPPSRDGDTSTSSATSGTRSTTARWLRSSS
jgi:hypothetical protein